MKLEYYGVYLRDQADDPEAALALFAKREDADEWQRRRYYQNGVVRHVVIEAGVTMTATPL